MNTRLMTTLRLVIISMFVAVVLGGCAGSQKHTFEIAGDSFLYDGEPVILRSGEMHFDRVPKEYWRHRLQMMKGMGLNTVSTYLFWNKAEPRQDQFDEQNFSDMAEFCKLAQDEGLMVIVRPGPYVCAEWDMGGLPWWLLGKDDMAVRTQHPFFLERSRKYLHRVGEALAPLQVTKGGPIIMVQVENEYGHYGADTAYMGKIRDYIVEAGFNVPLFQCDYYLKFDDRRRDLFCAVNFGSSEDARSCLDSLRRVMPRGPFFVAEFYPGWLDHWGEDHAQVSTEKIIEQLKIFHAHDVSYNFYMVHGGTSFGMWSGANFNETPEGYYNPQTSSYDYDAPIGEAGWPTPKYMALRRFIGTTLPPGEGMPPVPSRPPTMDVAEFTLTECAAVLDNLPPPICDSIPRNMEEYGQGYGYIVYSTEIPAGSHDELVFDRIGDFGIIMVDRKFVRTMDRRKKELACPLPARSEPARLDVIVDAMGRVNSERFIHDRKGIHGNVYLRKGCDSRRLDNWNVYPVELRNHAAPASLEFTAPVTEPQPAYYRGYFDASEQKDTFLNMSRWGKGLVWVNGHCLGRYWHIGPTRTMYLPGPWIKKGKNEVVVLDFLAPRANTITGEQTPILDDFLRPIVL